MPGKEFNIIMCVIVVVFPKMWLFCVADWSVLRLVEDPDFGQPILNATVPLGREVVLPCVVDHLGKYKVRKTTAFFFSRLSLFLLSIKQRAREQAGAPQRSKFVHKSQLI
jgi:hypothetical protein